MTIQEVIARLNQIDAGLTDDDGLKWFNLLYKIVTEKIAEKPDSYWNSPTWLRRLDVVFAGLYFDAKANNESGQQIPSAWEALFESRYLNNVDRIQFAMAGMNAHINRDLYFALEQVNREFNIEPNADSLERADFELVNDILEDAFPMALSYLHTGVFGTAAEYSGIIGKMLAMWSVRKARESAWNFWEILYFMPDLAREPLYEISDSTTGALGRALLLPLAVDVV